MRHLAYAVFGVLLMLVGVEIGLRALPVSTATHTGYYVHPDILTYPPHHRWTMATGWTLRDVQHMRSNNYGFAAHHEFSPGSGAIGLVGDSYVEASMLPEADRPAMQLERTLGGRRPVYALGGPGSSLLDYAARIRWANQTLQIKDFVVMMEPTDATQALCDTANVHAHCLDPATLEPRVQRRAAGGLLKSVLRESALAQYVTSQLKFDGSRLVSRAFWHSGTPQEAPGPGAGQLVHHEPSRGLDARRRAVIDATVSTFLDRLSTVPGLRMVFVLDMNRRNLRPDRNDPDEGHHLAERLRERGFTVAQGEPLFREHVRQSSLRLDMGPHDGHLNALGVSLLITAAARAMPRD